jgi:hypothetical protein
MYPDGSQVRGVRPEPLKKKVKEEASKISRGETDLRKHSEPEGFEVGIE